MTTKNINDVIIRIKRVVKAGYDSFQLRIMYDEAVALSILIMTIVFLML